MLTPNKYNIYKYFFAAFVLLFAASLAIGLPRQGDTGLVKQVVVGTMSAALVMFSLFLLTWLTRPTHPNEARSLALDKAQILLDRIARSKEGPRLTDAQSEEVSIVELVRNLNLTERKACESLLEEIYQKIPACLLHKTYGERDAPVLDWHKYDLCIIAAAEDVDFAKKIRGELTKQNNRLRIYLEREIGVPQDRAIRNVFYAGSRKCLALISVHMISHPRSREELNHAMSRGQQEGDEACRGYLMPIPIDKYGLNYMREEPYLAQYAKYLETSRDQKRLFDEIINKLKEEFILDSPATSPSQDPSPPNKPYAIALSFPIQLPIVKRVVEELEKRLAGDELFYFPKYEAETGPDLDIRLHKIYGEQSELVVVFLCAEYSRNRWCQVEWRATRELQQKHRTLLLRFDETEIPGVLNIDGVINCEHRSAAEIAGIIIKKLALIRQSG